MGNRWLYSWIDHEAMGFKPGWKLGKLCKKKHEWHESGLTLRRPCGHCDVCEKLRKIQESKLAPRKTERRWISEFRGLSLTPTDRRRLYKRLQRAKLREQGLTAKGTAPVNASGGVLKGERNEAIALESALRKSIHHAGRSPSVARLVMNEQRRYWRENPEAKKAHDKQWDRDSWWLEYQINPDRRMYVRQKSKRRKALLRDQMAHQIKPKQLRARFAQFGNCCAYCGAAGDMQIEHVIPISKGGTHAMGNIVPACQDCNFSKRDHEAERWYRSRPQFCEKRWRKICRVLGWDRSSVGQFAML